MTGISVAEPGRTTFDLLQYARFKQNPADTQGPQWLYFDNTKEKLTLKITEGKLLLSHGQTILESLTYQDGRDRIRGFCKGDSFLIVNKMKEENRRFRMKFLKDKDLSGEDMCKKCSVYFSKFFPVKMLQGSISENQVTENSKTEGSLKTLSGEITLSTMAKVVSGDVRERLPSVYQKTAVNIKPENIQDFLRLCLLDPTFPAFVGQVETALNKIKQNG